MSNKLKLKNMTDKTKEFEVINNTDKTISVYLNNYFVDLPGKSSFKVFKLNEQEERALKPLFVKKEIWYTGFDMTWEKPTSGITEYILPEPEVTDEPVVGEAITSVTLSYGSEFKVGKSVTPVLTLNPEGVKVKLQTYTATEGEDKVSLNGKTGEITFNSEGQVTVKVTITDNTEDANQAEGEVTFTITE